MDGQGAMDARLTVLAWFNACSELYIAPIVVSVASLTFRQEFQKFSNKSAYICSQGAGHGEGELVDGRRVKTAGQRKRSILRFGEARVGA